MAAFQRFDELFVSRALFEGALDATVRLYGEALTKVQTGLADELAGKDAGQIEEILVTRFDAMRSELASLQTLEVELPAGESERRSRG